MDVGMVCHQLVVPRLPLSPHRIQSLVCHNGGRHRLHQRGFSRLQNTNLNKKTYGIAFDIDGVLLRGKHPIPGATTCITQLLLTQAVESAVQPRPFVCLTNGGGMTEQAKADVVNTRLLPHSPVKLRAGQMIQSHTPMRQLVKAYGDKCVLCIGTGDLRDVMASYGFKHVLTADQIARHDLTALPHLSDQLALHDETAHTRQHRLEAIPPIAAVFVLHDPIVWDRDVQIMLDVLLYHEHVRSDQQLPLFYSNPDIVFSGSFRAPRLAQGAFRLAVDAIYQRLTGRQLQYTLYGKPERSQFAFAYNVLNEEALKLGWNGADRAYMIGDNVHADIKGANQSDKPFTSIYVESGTLGLADDADTQPKHICKDVTEAVELIATLELQKSA